MAHYGHVDNTSTGIRIVHELSLDGRWQDQSSSQSSGFEILNSNSAPNGQLQAADPHGGDPYME